MTCSSSSTERTCALATKQSSGDPVALDDGLDLAKHLRHLPELARHRTDADVDRQRQAECRRAHAGPVALDHAGLLEPPDPLRGARRRQADLAGEVRHRLATVRRQRPQNSPIQGVEVAVLESKAFHLFPLRIQGRTTGITGCRHSPKRALPLAWRAWQLTASVSAGLRHPSRRRPGSRSARSSIISGRRSPSCCSPRSASWASPGCASPPPQRSWHPGPSRGACSPERRRASGGCFWRSAPAWR